MSSLGEALQTLKKILEQNPEVVQNAETESEMILRSIFRDQDNKVLDRVQFFSNLSSEISPAEEQLAHTLASMRASGKPLQYLTGVQNFLEHEYQVGPEVLIPRPETEFLVQKTIELLEEAQKQKKTPIKTIGLEVGTGSGVISIELLDHFSALKMIASDISSAALKKVELNAQAILGAEGVSRLHLMLAKAQAQNGHSSQMEVLQVFEKHLTGKKADFLISNPPYLTREDPIASDVLQYEPHSALFAPEGDPLFFYRQFAEKSSSYLVEGGKIFLEIPHQRAEQIAGLFKKTQWDIEIALDLTERKRVLIGVKM